MAFLRWGAATLVATAVLMCGSSAQAGVLDDRWNEVRKPGTIAAAQADVEPLASLEAEPTVRDSVALADLRPIEDFHPETDRWTDRHNRIKMTGWLGMWAFSGELDIAPTFTMGLRLSWEVPGFIAIRWDSGLAPFPQLEVRNANPTGGYRRDIDGFVHAHTLSIAIFNPELSTGGLAFWAGFGLGVWIYDFNESVSGVNYSFDTVDGIMGKEDALNLSGNVFIELDYEVMEVFHLGSGLRQHFLLADHTTNDSFVEVNGSSTSNDNGRNSGPLDDLAGVTEMTLNLTIVF